MFTQKTVKKEFYLYKKKEMKRRDFTGQVLYRVILSDQESFLANTMKPTEKFAEGDGENLVFIFNKLVMLSSLFTVSPAPRCTNLLTLVMITRDSALQLSFCFKIIENRDRSLTLANNCCVYSHTEQEECRTFLFRLFFTIVSSNQ